MAEIVLAIGYSHTPYLFCSPPQWPKVRERIRKGIPIREDVPRENPHELQQKYNRSMAAFTKLRELVQKSGADAMVIVGDDQKEIFSSIVAGFTIYTGEKVEGKKWPGRVREVTGNQECVRVANQQRLAEDVVSGMAQEGYDVAFFAEPENKEDGFGHAFVPPLNYLTPALDLPVLPILLNCYYAPQPTALRCFRFGRSLKKIIKRSSSARRVIVAASGGLWHTPGKEDAAIDEEFDRAFLAALASGQWKKVAELPDDHLQSGTGEVRNWIVGVGVTGRKKWQVLDYIPLYYSPIGLGFAACKMGG